MIFFKENYIISLLIDITNRRETLSKVCYFNLWLDDNVDSSTKAIHELHTSFRCYITKNSGCHEMVFTNTMAFAILPSYFL